MAHTDIPYIHSSRAVGNGPHEYPLHPRFEGSQEWATRIFLTSMVRGRSGMAHTDIPNTNVQNFEHERFRNIHRHIQRVAQIGHLTRPDTRQDSRGRLGRGRNEKTARNSKIFWTYRRTDLPTDTARCRVACPRLKTIKGCTSFLCRLSKNLAIQLETI